MPKHQLSIDIPLHKAHPLRVSAESHTSDALRSIAGDTGHIDLVDPDSLAINLVNIEIELPKGVELEEWLRGNKKAINMFLREEIAKNPLTEPITFDGQVSDKTSISATASSPQLDALRASVTKRITSLTNITGLSVDPNNSVTLATAKQQTGLSSVFKSHKDITAEDVVSVGEIVPNQPGDSNPEMAIELRHGDRTLTRTSSRPIAFSDRVDMDTIKEMIAESFPAHNIKDNGDGILLLQTTDTPPRTHARIDTINATEGIKSLVVSGNSRLGDFKENLYNALFKSHKIDLADTPTYDDTTEALEQPEIPDKPVAAQMAASSTNSLFKEKHADPKHLENYTAHKERVEQVYDEISAQYDSDCTKAKSEYEAQCKADYLDHLSTIDGFSIDGNNLRHGDTIIGTINIDVTGNPCCSIIANKDYAPLCRQFQKDADALPKIEFAPFVPPDKPGFPEFKEPATPIPLPMPKGSSADIVIGKLFEAYEGSGKFQIKFDEDNSKIIVATKNQDNKDVTVCEAHFGLIGGTPHLYLVNPGSISYDMAEFGRQFAADISNSKVLKHSLAPKQKEEIQTTKKFSVDICEHPTIDIPDAPQIADDLKGDTEYQASFNAAYASYVGNCEQEQKDAMLASIKKQVMAAASKAIPKGKGTLSLDDSGVISFTKPDGSTDEIGSLDIKLEDNNWSIDITPNPDKIQLCRILHLKANTMEFKAPIVEIDKFEPPDPPNISIPFPEGPSQETVSKICDAYSKEGAEFEIEFAEGAAFLKHNKNRVCNVVFDFNTGEMQFKDRTSLDVNLQEITHKFKESIADNPWIKYEAPKEEIKATTASLHSEAFAHPTISVPDAPEPEAHLKLDPDYMAKFDAEYASHTSACEQAQKDQIKDSITKQFLDAANSKLKTGKITLSDAGVLIMQKGDKVKEIGELNVELNGNKWSISMDSNEGSAVVCKALQRVADDVKFKAPDITLPEFKAPKQELKTMTFAMERAQRLADKDVTKKVANLSMQANLGPGDWNKVADSFIKHMEGLKDKEAVYAKGDTSPTYMKAYQDEGKNFYQSMQITKVSDYHIQISGKDPDIKDGGEYVSNIKYDPQSKSLSTSMGSPASDKQILTTAEFLKQAALASGNNHIRVTGTDDVKGLIQTIAIFNSQGLNVELSPMVEYKLRTHIEQELQQRNGTIPSVQEIKAEIDRVMTDKFVTPDPATNPPAPPTEQSSPATNRAKTKM